MQIHLIKEKVQSISKMSVELLYSWKYQPGNRPVGEFLGSLKMFIFVLLKWASSTNMASAFKKILNSPQKML